MQPCEILFSARKAADRIGLPKSNYLYWHNIAIFFFFVRCKNTSGVIFFLLLFLGKSNEGIMQIIPGLMEMKVRQVAAGAEHSALVTGKKFCTCLL